MARHTDDDDAIPRAELDAIIERVRAEAALLEEADGAAIKGIAAAWNVVHGDPLSVDHMTDEELAQAIIEDLLNVHGLQVEGKPLDFTAPDFHRFLGGDPERERRVDLALDDPFVRSLLERREDGQLRIDPRHLQDAMDFADVWLDGFEPLTEGVVYCRGSLSR